MKLRTYVPTLPPRTPYISEAEVFSRTLTAIRTLKAMPDRERRFLASGTKAAWPATLVEWSDLLAQAEQTPDDIEPREKINPKRSEISDALVAGEWFAKLALLPENIDEFEKRVEEYRRGRDAYGNIVRSPQVDDQRLLTLYSQGWSLKLIGQRFGWNENQCERRLFEIARNLHRIANKTARYADLYRIQKLSKERIPA
jgi:hypothetical protein